MKAEEKEKLCYQCEGRIPFDENLCPYCHAKQMPASERKAAQPPLFKHQSLEDSLTSLYTPPYQGKKPQFVSEAHRQEETWEEEPSMFQSAYSNPSLDPMLETPSNEEQVPVKNSLWPIMIFFAGMNFSILGIMQLLFSKGGVLRLEWDANYWFFYFLLGLPLLLLGYKKVQKL
jgi:hypothetical protein